MRNNATPQEIILWSRLKNSQIGFKFRRQHSVGNYILDFYCTEKRLAVEIDGFQHGEIIDATYDTARTNYLNSLRI